MWRAVWRGEDYGVMMGSVGMGGGWWPLGWHTNRILNFTWFPSVFVLTPYWRADIPLWLPLHLVGIATALLWMFDRPRRYVGGCKYCGFNVPGRLARGRCGVCGRILDGSWLLVGLALSTIAYVYLPMADLLSAFVLLWSTVFILLVLLPAALLIWRRVWPRVVPGFCHFCGYNLRGNVSGVCPECGTPTPTDDGLAAPTVDPPNP